MDNHRVTAELAGRSYARVYRVTGRSDLHRFVLDAVSRAGGKVLWASPATRAPVYLGIQAPDDERIGVLCYPFRCSPETIKGRAADEHRLQVRYGAEETWDDDHLLGVDVASVDTTVVLGVHLSAGIFVGLDPLLYSPLPMGISVEFKEANVRDALTHGWTVWERETKPGRRRGRARSPQGIEALVAFRPERFLDYARFERYATGLGLDPPLRFKAAEEAATAPAPGGAMHKLEEQFDLSSREILELITRRHRLEIAVRGGVAEHHLEAHLRASPEVGQVRQIDEDGKPDFEVTLRSGRRITIECKNVSPVRRAGEIKVEVQKTRASKGDPASRFYRLDQFDLVAACLWPISGRWEFRFKATKDLMPHPDFPRSRRPDPGRGRDLEPGPLRGSCLTLTPLVVPLWQTPLAWDVRSESPSPSSPEPAASTSVSSGRASGSPPRSSSTPTRQTPWRRTSPR